MDLINFTNLKEKVFHYKNMTPNIDPSVFLAPGSKIIGNVTIGEFSSVWYNTVIRGDVHYIKIGNKTNIQDNSMLHVTNGKYPLNIGNEVTIGHSVNLHGCTLNDRCFVGIGAIILDGAVIEPEAMVAAGAVVPPGVRVPSGFLFGGVPAKQLRKLTAFELNDFIASAERYVQYSVDTYTTFISSGIKY